MSLTVFPLIIEFRRSIEFWSLSKLSIQFETVVFYNCFNSQVFSRQKQLNTCNLNLYITNTSEINAGMRAILVEWLSDVSRSCEHNPETLFMAVNYVDRFLSQKTIPLTHLQLIGISCLFISAYFYVKPRKLNDVHIPKIDEFSYVTENLYSVSDVFLAIILDYRSRI